MIQEALKFLVDELNQYFSIKLGATTEKRVVLGNIARAYDNDSGGNSGIAGTLVVSLVNVEEDRVSKLQENYIKTNQGVIYKNPPVPLNLYVLFSANRTDYNDCLKWLSLVIQFFQHQSVFTPQIYPAMDVRIQKLIADIYSLSFEQINHLWGTLGGKYMPSVLFRIKQVNIDEELVSGEGQLIKEISVSALNKQLQ